MSAADFSKSIAIRFASGGLEAILTLRPGLTAEERTFEYIRSAVLASGVVPRRIDEEALRTGVEAYDFAEGSPEQVIATGDAAEPASPVRVELRDDVLAELEAAEALRRMADGSTPPDDLSEAATHGSPDPGAECDGLAQSHYNRSAFVVVEAGRALGRLVPAFEGKDGEDVTGAVIQAKPLTAKTYEPDDSVQVDAEGLISARVPGLLDVTGAGPIVRDTLDIDSDVDFSTGNVNFPGDVNIARGVRDLFQVRVGGSLHAGDVIEAATIEVQRHATLAVGMAGRGKGSITVGRDLEARYLDDVDVHVGGNLRIDRELSNCRIEVQGALEAPKCRVVGGEVRVVGRCEVAQAGSPAGAPTVLILGHIPEFETIVARSTEMLDRLDAQSKDVQERLKMLSGLGSRMTAQQAEELTELQFLVMDGAEKSKKMTAGLGRVVGLMDRVAEPSLTVHKAVYAGVRLHIGVHIALITADVAGPLEVKLDEAGDPVIVDLASASSRPISAVAEVTHDPDSVDLDAARAIAGSQDEAPGQAA